MGVERLLALMQMGSPVFRPRVPDVYLVHQGEFANRFAEQAAERLRDAGLAVVLHCGGGSFKSQMKKADASGARFAIVIGDDEARAEEVSLKPLRELEEQVRVSIAEAVDLITKGERREARGERGR
jgi:histidyl-tRNA synthetase